MRRTRIMLVGALTAALALVASGIGLLPAVAASGQTAAGDDGAAFTPGTSGIGDPYYPRDGNGGYDVSHYGLELSYDPDTDVLDGVATIDLRATQNLSRFNFDFDGLTIDDLTVDGTPAAFTRSHGELRITPAMGIPVGSDVTVVVTYHGVPNANRFADEGSGWFPTDDGVLVVGEPHGASTWFPANDHPRDKASFDIAMTVPDGLTAVANGSLVSHDSAAGHTRWVWHAPAPMATYLATVDVGVFDLNQYHDAGARPGGVDYVDAIDPDLLDGVTPHTGSNFMLSQSASSSFKRLRRTIAVPAAGATMSFWVNRDTEANWDFVFVEAHTPGNPDDWTTLPDAQGHTSRDRGFSCPSWLDLHPFLTHYQTDRGNNTCKPTGTTGAWNAVSGKGDGWEQWTVDLGAFAGGDAQVSISYASDETVQGSGVAVDDIEVSTGEGSTSFEADADPLDGWQVPGAPASSPGNENDWINGTVDDAPESLGELAQDATDREPEILAFLADNFGAYPFTDSGSIIDDKRDVGFALENQTRPVYAPEFFGDPVEGASVVAHELAHQWYGDQRQVKAWKHVWLNEGFATYAEWLWSEHEDNGTPQQIFDELYSNIPADDPFWSVEVADPGTLALFSNPVYYRGAMALQALRVEVGDADFFQILQQWAAEPASVASTTRHFIALAEEVSGQQLDGLFQTWVYSTHKPSSAEAGAVAADSAGAPAPRGPLSPTDR